ncbi:MAG: SH3 domain-containing protein [Lachnospiraceae bacterium]|nr:SH3 domain-containing protein [Lachnospiraceae bacterium]
MSKLRKRGISRAMAVVLMAVMFAACFAGFSCDSYAASSSAVVSTGGANLNVRKGPSTDYEIVGRLKKGTKVTVTGSSGAWYKINASSGIKGFVHGDYLAFSGGGSYPVTARVTEGGVPLKLRKKATTASSILAEIPRGSKLKVTGKYNSEWYSAAYSGKNGYVYGEYVIMPSGNTSSTPGPSSGSSSGSSGSSSSASKYKYPAVKLKVPFYSQFDSRWASLKLGKTSYTIRQSGCVVCGLAQIDSFLRKKTITPDKMLKTLSFDSEGRLYWPSDCKAYNGSDYLKKIYNQLKAGNPVLVGGFTPAGKQHWVVATGYKKNSNSLSASNILINDCSDRYDTLAEYQDSYSRFYKIVYKN